MVRVGLIDSGVSTEQARHVDDERRFVGARGNRGRAHPDLLGHGSQVAQCVLEHCTGARLVVAQIFGIGREAEVDCVSEAIDWLVREHVQIINMSFGIAGPNAGLERACREAAGRGVVLVASSPARGLRVFPAGYEECIAVSGDARCAPGEYSWLDSETADFGTHPMLIANCPDCGGGASIAAARMSGLVSGLLMSGAAAANVRQLLQRSAHYIGPECRRA